MKVPISEILEMPYEHFQLYLKYSQEKPLGEKETLIYMFARLFNLLHCGKEKYKVEDYIHFLKDTDNG